jgi:hypothetical protein
MSTITNRDNGNKTGRAAYRAYMTAVTAGGHWSPLPRKWVAALGIKAAALISHTITVGKASADEGGWITATPRFIENGLGFDADCQERVLGRLAALGVVEIRSRGGDRQLRVHTGALDTAVSRDG